MALEGHLRALAHRREDEQKRHDRGRGGRDEAGAIGPVLTKQPIEVTRPHRAMHQHRRGEQPDVADSVGREGPHGRPNRVAAFEKESDQQG